jgi:multidrug efflux pump subunit AcrA (membrane-fusion protein)
MKTVAFRSTPGGLIWIEFALLCLLGSCQKKVETTQPTEQSITESVYASGFVKSRQQYDVFSTVTGTVDEILVSVGAEVKKGQPILRLKNTSAQLSSENARIAARFAEVSQGKDRLNEAQAAVQVARTRALNDSLLMVRQKNLSQQNVGAKVEWEQRQLAFENSSSSYQSALARFRELQRQINLAAEQTRLNAGIAAQQLSDFTITSRMDGRVYDIKKQVGELVNPQTPVAVIGAARDYYLELEIDETDVSRVKPNQRVLVSLSSYPQQTWEGVVERINPIMNERSKLFTIEASFVKSPPALYPNLTAEANIFLNYKEKALTIPTNYLVNDTTVLLESGETRSFKPGLKDYQRVEVISGLTATDVLQKPGR